MRYLLICAFVFLGSCATPYVAEGQKSGLLGGGAESFWYSSNVLVVTTSGNAYTRDKRVVDFAYLKASERAIEAGYRYFTVAEIKNTGKRETFTTNTPETTEFNATAYSTGDTTYASGTATTSGGTSQTTMFFPGRKAAFVMYDNPPDGYRPGQFYDAYAVINELGPKYIKDFLPIVAGDAAIIASPPPPAQ